MLARAGHHSLVENILKLSDASVFHCNSLSNSKLSGATQNFVLCYTAYSCMELGDTADTAGSLFRVWEDPSWSTLDFYTGTGLYPLWRRLYKNSLPSPKALQLIIFSFYKIWSKDTCEKDRRKQTFSWSCLGEDWVGFPAVYFSITLPE